MCITVSSAPKTSSIVLLASLVLLALLPARFNEDDKLIREPPNIQLLQQAFEQITDQRDCLKLASVLLNDIYGIKTKVIMEVTGNNASRLTKEVCKHWLTSNEMHTVTWNSFINAANTTGLSEIASGIKKRIDPSYLTVDAVVSSSYPTLIHEMPSLVIIEKLGLFDLIHDYSFYWILLQDNYGKEVKRSVEGYSNNMDKELCRRWLQGEGKQPVTWRTFIQVLNVTNQGYRICPNLCNSVTSQR